jgi:hypothetical protein
VGCRLDRHRQDDEGGSHMRRAVAFQPELCRRGRGHLWARAGWTAGVVLVAEIGDGLSVGPWKG